MFCHTNCYLYSIERQNTNKIFHSSFSSEHTMSSGDNKQLQTLTKPALHEKEAIELTERVFGLKVSEIRALPSYDDQNFHVRVTRKEGIEDCADDYVLKIINSEDSQNPELIEVQTRIMIFLNAEGFPSAVPHLTKDGNIMSLESIGTGSLTKKYMVRLLTYLPGTPLAKCPTNPQILYEIGKLAARLDRVLSEKFHHPLVKSLHRGKFIWNLANVPLLDQYIHALGQSEYREVVSQVIQQFKEKILPNLSNFRACINHGDINDHNILVDSNPASSLETAQYRVSGILDFSDMSYGYYVFEVAIAIMYMMIESKDPLSVGGHVLAGFESIVPLTPEERGALFLLVSSRFSQSLVVAAHTLQLYPENQEYLMITARVGWKHLVQLFEVGQEAVEKIWFETADTYAHAARA
ncbi:PREDICTED: hydroxylysine kinase isoform X1 [Gavialis gangeticus]|uniref:hydroxylysine kinase isoform X1 n=2 Tax=Gavialis gangeticus TaxID=94835 RepID=UPI00092EA70D|nr:PREDICTED: hydroxylysine kinase isoform X1 [Gavialis gangeticus]